MAKMLDLDEMLIAADASGMPGAQQFVDQAVELARALSRALAEHLEVAGPVECDFEPGVDGGGILGGFAPKEGDQPCPAALQPFDKDGDWEPRSPAVLDRQAGG